jgi:DNA-binding MarR family transcriptional regulator
MSAQNEIATDLESALTYRLHALQKMTDRASKATYFAATGMSFSECRCLAAVGSFAPLSVNDLAFRANLDKGQASRAAQVLVDQKLVRKATSSEDARGIVMVLTPSGEKKWSQVMALVKQRNDEICDCLSKKERAQLGSLLDRLIVHARKHSA